MADQDQCEYCIHPDNDVVRSSPCSRSEALALYVYLQRQGFLPAMCESHAGHCRVCYSEKERQGG